MSGTQSEIVTPATRTFRMAVEGSIEAGFDRPGDEVRDRIIKAIEQALFGLNEEFGVVPQRMAVRIIGDS